MLEGARGGREGVPMMSFDVTDLTAIEKLLDRNELPTQMDTSGAKYFKNYLEDNEPQKNKSGDYEAFARDKYMGMVLYDAADSVGDDDDESEAATKERSSGFTFRVNARGAIPKDTTFKPRGFYRTENWTIRRMESGSTPSRKLRIQS